MDMENERMYSLAGQANHIDPPLFHGPGVQRYLVLHGSHAYGLATPESDEDWRGVYQLPNDAFLGLDTPQRTWSGYGGQDAVAWELGHFVHLLLKGNPNIIEMLWIDPEHVYLTSPVIESLRAVRRHFITRQMGHAYLGWIRSELAHEDNVLTPKRLSHAARLAWQLEGALATGDLAVRLPEARLVGVRDIKAGNVPAVKVRTFALARAKELDAAVDALPDAPTDLANHILLGARHHDG
jgi:predicted nucleotidyltransferase